MPLVTKINSYDISTLVQAAADGFDPAPQFADPQFAGNALSDGDLFIQMTNRNKEWTIPLIINAPGTAYTNLVPNPSAESATTGWTEGAGNTLARTTAWARSGVYAFRDSGTAIEYTLRSTAGTSGIPVTAGTTYTASASVNVIDALGSLGTVIKVLWYDAAGVNIAGTLVSTASSAGTGEKELTVSGAAPATAAFAAIWIDSDGTVAAQSFDLYIDAIQLTATAGRVGYFDGSFPCCIWNGTAHNSSSTQVTGPDGVAGEVRRINSHLKQGVALEYREDGAAASTHFDVEAARLDVEYRYQRNRQGVGKFVLKVWTRPFGHTGTTRVVASAVASMGAFDIPVASLGLSGDADTQLRVLASAAAFPNVMLWGRFAHSDAYVRHAGVNVLKNAAASHIADPGSSTGTAFALPSGGYVSLSAGGVTYVPTFLHGETVRLFVSARAMAHASNVGASESINTPTTFPAVIRTQVSRGFTGASGPWVKVCGATAYGASSYRLYDMGKVAIPTAGPNNDQVLLLVRTSPTNLATALASPITRIDEIFAIPIQGAIIGPPAYTHDMMLADARSGVVYAGASLNEALAQARGTLPAVPPLPTGTFSVLTARLFDRAWAASQRTSHITISAREQFTYLR